MKNLLFFILVTVGFNVFGGITITNGLTHEHLVSKNEQQTGIVEIQNIGKTVQRVLFYLNDFQVDCKDEIFQPTDTGVAERSNSTWVTLSATERLLGPGEKYTLKYDIKVPNKSLKGSFWSLLMVEEKPVIDTNRTKIGVHISSNIRYAVQLVTSFSDEEEVSVSFENVELQEENGLRALAVKLFNESSTMVRPVVKMEIYNELGDLIMEQRAKDRKLYPAQCRTYYIPTEGIAIGKYQAVLVADCGNGDVFGLTVNLNVDE